MKAKKRATQIGSPYNSVKQNKDTKVVVQTEILLRTHDGHVIANNILPDGLQCLIICKIALLELEIETMIDNYLKRFKNINHGK
jgi:hypothetical protein